MSDTRITIKNKYLVIPVNIHSKRKKVCIYNGDKLVFDFDAHIDYNAPRYYAYINVERFRGMTLEFVTKPRIDLRVTFVDAIPTAGAYREEYRPMVHFSSRIGWINDPNGLVYSEGKYHMFFQHNPAGSTWGNMTWGHAISEDLVHWHEVDGALHPDETGTMFSGSAIVDKNNVTGLKNSAHDPILLYYTAAGGNSLLSEKAPFTQCLAYSLDGGITFQKYEKNPIIPHIMGGNRDPKVVFCEELNCYLLALYLDGNQYAIFRSDNLLDFKEMQRLILPGDAECPDLYPINVENEPGVRKWIFSGASDKYLVGEMEGGKNGGFKPVQAVKSFLYDNRSTPPRNSYAAQTFSGIDNGVVRAAWEVLHAPESVFENQMSIPCRLSLHKIGNEYRLSSLPVEAIENLRVNTEIYSTADTRDFVRPLHRKAYDMEITAPKDSPDFTVSFFGYSFSVRPSENTFSYQNTTMPLSYTDGDLKIRILSDTLGCTIYLDNGLIYSVAASLADYGIRYLTVAANDKDVPLNVGITLHTLKGIW